MAEPQPHTPVRGVSGPVTNIVCWLFLLVALLTMVARMITRIKITKFFGSDDIFIIISFVILAILTVLTSIAVGAGLGSHFDTLTEHNKLRAQKWVLVIRAFAAWPLAVPKLSVVALLVRVFEPRRWVAIVFYSLATVGLVIAAVTSIVWVAQCSPIQKQFDSTVDGTCWAPAIVYAIAEFQFVQSVLYDFVFALYPLTVLLKLKMNTQRKVGVCINMALGIIAGIVGLVKVALINEVGATQALDPTYVESQVTVEIAVEASLLIIAACVPTSGPVLLRLKAMVTGATITNASRQQYYGAGQDHATIFDERTKNKTEVDVEFGESIPMTARAAPFSTNKSLPRLPSHARRYQDSSRLKDKDGAVVQNQGLSF